MVIACAVGFSACWMESAGAVKLEKPTNLYINQSYNKLTWNYVVNASYGYTVRAAAEQDAEKSQTFDVTNSNGCSLSPLVGPEVYEIRVLAKGNGSSFIDSEWSEPIQFTVAAPIYSSEGLIFDYHSRSGGFQLMNLGTNRDTNVIIPSSYYTIYKGSLPVKSIADRAFNNATWVESVSVPSSVESIGSWAFSGCVNISTITLSVWCTSIGANAFNGWGEDQTIRILAASTDNFSKDWLKGCDANVVYE